MSNSKKVGFAILDTPNDKITTQINIPFTNAHA